jgi:hypothetical protein
VALIAEVAERVSSCPPHARTGEAKSGGLASDRSRKLRRLGGGAQSAEARAAGEVRRILAESDGAPRRRPAAQLTEIMTAERAHGLDALPR